MTDNFPSWLEDDGASASRRSDVDGFRRTKKRRSRTLLALVVTLVLLGLIALAVVFTLQARTAQAELRAAMPLVVKLREEALTGESDAAGDTAAQLREHTNAARDAVSGPHWSIAAHVPYIGPNIAAARTATEVVDGLAAEVLPDLVSATDVVDPANLAPQDGRIDLAPFIEVAPQVIAAHDAVRDAQERLGDINDARILKILRDPLTNLRDQVDEVASLTATASRAVQLLPPMLGAEEPREYILMVQNNSEPRSAGGLTGAFLLLRADDGAVVLVDQRSAGEVGYFPESAVELTDTEVALFGTQLGRYPGNITMTPDFPRSAVILTEMWRQGVGGEVDGVFSLDPVALGSLLESTGPIELPQDALRAVGAPEEFLGDDGALTADNAADLMLNGVYRYIEDPADQDAFFEIAAAGIFSRAMSGGVEADTTIAALAAAADEGRLYAWSAHPEEQKLLDGTALGGGLTGDDGNGAPVVGVYVNDVSGSKIAYYQEMDVELTSKQCYANGTQDLTLKVTLTSDVPEDVTHLPDTLAGSGRIVPKGDMRTNLLVYAPTRGRITDVRDPAGPTDVSPQVHEGQVAVARQVLLRAGQSVTTEVDVTTGPGLSHDPVLRMTPGPGRERFTSSTLTCRQ